MEKILKRTLISGKFQNVSEAQSKKMKAVKGKGNKSTEVRFCLGLVRAKVSGWKMHAKLLGKPDIFFPEQRLIVFLDGCFWHGCPDCGHFPKTNALYWQTKILRNIERDKKNLDLLAQEGYLVLRFWEHELKKDLGGCVDRVLSGLESGSA